jgi:hypothetical protein
MVAWEPIISLPCRFLSYGSLGTSLFVVPLLVIPNRVYFSRLVLWTVLLPSLSSVNVVDVVSTVCLSLFIVKVYWE